MNKLLVRLTKKAEERTQTDSVRNERGHYNWSHKNTRDCKKLLCALACQQSGQAGRNGYISRNIWPTKTESHTKKEIWTDQLRVRRLYQKSEISPQKSRTREFCWWILPDFKTINTNPSQTLPKKKKKWWNASKLILQGQQYPETKIRQGCHKKRKLQGNIPDEHRCKNQQNISRPGWTIH